MPDDSCLLLLNGELADPARIKRLALRLDGVICADGGARHAAALGLEPRFVVGDMDSLPKKLPPWKKTVYWTDFDEDRSDFEKSLMFARSIGVRRVWVAGLSGGRLDQVLVNWSLFERYCRDLDLTAVDGGSARILETGRYRLPLRRGERFSLLAATPRAVASVKGARYPLSRAALTPGSRGLSNTATGRVSLTVHSGRLWVITP